VKPELLQAKERLARNLSHLSYYCRRGSLPLDDAWSDWRLHRSLVDSYKLGLLGCWPTREFLAEIERDVIVLAGSERKKPIFPVWKAFLQVNKRTPKLKLKARVDQLIARARDLLPAESELNKVVRLAIAGKAQAQCSYQEKVLLDPQKLAKLLQADRQLVKQREMAESLMHWTIDIGHPCAGDWGYIEKLHPTVEEFKGWQRLTKRRESVRRHRSGKKFSLKSVSPK
jgi:hypothetical protein